MAPVGETVRWDKRPGEVDRSRLPVLRLQTNGGRHCFDLCVQQQKIDVGPAGGFADGFNVTTGA